MRLSSFRHVPELDGIRGIAIIAVLIHHHLTPFSLSGGFLGVDLFFVLSGFLITGLLLTEFEQTNAISLRNFYMRRVLRLGPALLIYLTACLAVAVYTNSIDLGKQARLILIAIGYATNWRMAFGWDPALDTTAIIWSLSIEEQFYLAWPVILCGCLLLKLRRSVIGAGLIAVIILILIHRASLFDSGADLSRLYYGTDTRADALLVGCVVALFPSISLHKHAIRMLQVASLICVVVLSYLVATSNFTDNYLYRGGFTGVALLTAVVIWVAVNCSPVLLSALLTFRLLRWIGQISYGLYLWHWLVVRTTSFYYLGYWEPWARLALAVGISAASFYLIEKRVNKLKKRFAAQHVRSGERRTVLPEPASVAPMEVTLAN